MRDLDTVCAESIAKRRSGIALCCARPCHCNESITPLANAEDRCNGQFWQGRFQSKALLIDLSGRTVGEDKKGAFPSHVNSLLNKLAINEEAWVEAICKLEQSFGIAIGTETALNRYNHNRSMHWLRGKRLIHKLYRQFRSQVA